MQDKFYGQFEVPVDRFIFERYFPDKNIKGTFVECGAFDGLTECSCKFFEETMDWHGINLEPVPLIFEKLQQNRPASRNLNAGLSDKVGPRQFHAVNHPQFGLHTTIGAVEHAPDFKQALTEGGSTFEEITVQMMDWSTLVAQEQLTQIDLMVLDVEGHELSVLAGMAGSPILPHLMCVEFGHIGLDVLRREMDQLGYEYDVNSYANAFFIRKDKVPLFLLRRAAAERLGPAVNEPTASGGNEAEELSLLRAQNQSLFQRNTWLENREAELVELIGAMENSRGWKALGVLKQLAGRGSPAAASIAPAASPVLQADTVSGADERQHSPSGPGQLVEADSHSADLVKRIAALEAQQQLAEEHHVRGLWHALDKISMIELQRDGLACIVCRHEGGREEFEHKISDCIFGGGRLERYVCPNCDAIFGAKKFLELDQKMIDLDYRLLYSRYREGDSQAAEFRAFETLAPNPGEGIVLNWGAGAWNDTTQKVRDMGYNCWSYEPNAPSMTPNVIKSKEDIPAQVSGIFSNNVIEHFPDPVQQFKAFHHLLPRGGRMAHSSPCYEYLYPFTRFHTLFLLGRSPQVLAERTGFRIADRVDDGEFHCVVFEKI